MSDDYFGFIAYTPPALAAELPTLLDSALSSLSFSVAIDTPRTKGEFRRTYSHSSGWRLECAGSSGVADHRPDWQNRPAWAFFPIQYQQVRTLSPAPLVRAITDACTRTQAILGRSFHPGGDELPHLEEFSGAIDILDWLQYLGPAIASVIGPERLRNAGFYDVQELAGGAFLALTRATYLDEWPFPERRPLMNRLGLAPRIMRHKTSATEWAEMRWC